MTDFFEVNFAKLRALKDEQGRAQEVYRLAREKLQSLNLRVENLERLMAEEVIESGNAVLQAEFEGIKARPSQRLAHPVQSAPVNKTDILARELMKENMQGRGTTPKELYELLQSRGFEGMTLEYTQSTLGKLKMRGFVEQKNKRYFLSELGLEHYEKVTDLE